VRLTRAEHYFEMSRPDAERALNIYKTFGKQTDQVVQYLSLARQYEASTRLEVPKLKHAPTTLTASLEEYLKDADFEINRRQYLAQQEAKRTGKPVSAVAAPPPKVEPIKTNAAPAAGHGRTASKGPAPDLIDFFASIEDNQQTMGQPTGQQQQQPFATSYNQNQQFQQFQQSAQPTGYNPFLQQQQHQQQQQQQQVQQQPQQGMPQYQQQAPLQPDFTGAGFGGYGPQPQQQFVQQPFGFSSLQSIPQNGVADFSPQQQHQQPMPQAQSPVEQLQPQQTSTNPFRQSMMPTGGVMSPTSPMSRQSTNPFAKHTTPISPVSPMQGNGHFQPQAAGFSSPPTSPPPQQHQSPAPLQAQRTGTNPFAKAASLPPGAPAAQPLVPNVTGTNPFRQSQFVNQATGMGWQHMNQGTLGGYDVNSVPTQPVFPRPGAH
jgi:phosphatidylinositol-binding clathrin assembly protein